MKKGRRNSSSRLGEKEKFVPFQTRGKGKEGKILKGKEE